jgi:hypothetical protein
VTFDTSWEGPEIGESETGETKTKVLGKIIDLCEKTIRLAPKTLGDLAIFSKNLQVEMTLRTFLKIWGTIIFATETLHLPLHQFPGQLATLSHMCALFISGHLELEDKLPSQKQIKEDLAYILDWEVWNQKCYLPPQSLDYEAIIYTDASSDLGAYVLKWKGKTLVNSFTFPQDTEHINEKEAFAGAIGIQNAASLGITSLLWCTDSKVVYHCVQNGRSKNQKINTAVGNILNADVWKGINWVPSAENIADGPSRNTRVVETPLQGEHEIWAEISYFGSRWRGGA